MLCFIWAPWKKYPEFGLVSDDDAEIGGRATATDARAAANAHEKKRQLAEGEGARASIDRALDRAIFQEHNSILTAKMLMKYGDAEDKATVLRMLREFSKKGKENKVDSNESPLSTVVIPFTIPSRISALEGPDTGEEIGIDGLTRGQRVCKQVYYGSECMESLHGFPPADVVKKLNGRIGVEVVKDISNFLMSEMAIFTTGVDDHYKGTDA